MQPLVHGMIAIMHDLSFKPCIWMHIVMPAINWGLVTDFNQFVHGPFSFAGFSFVSFLNVTRNEENLISVFYF